MRFTWRQDLIQRLALARPPYAIATQFYLFGERGLVIAG